MLKYFFVIIAAVHGLIHFMGFAKAFNYGNISQLTKDISKPMGVTWMITACLFTVATIFILVKNDMWSVIAILAAIVSQFLIYTVWKDAKFGTIANLIIVLVAIAGTSAGAIAGALYEAGKAPEEILQLSNIARKKKVFLNGCIRKNIEKSSIAK